MTLTFTSPINFAKCQLFQGFGQTKYFRTYCGRYNVINYIAFQYIILPQRLRPYDPLF